MTLSSMGLRLPLMSSGVSVRIPPSRNTAVWKQSRDVRS